MATIQPRFGVDYYPEHWPQERWETDAELMKEAGFELVRLAEFSWSKIQPRRDEWHWEWLDKAIVTLASAGLEVILCTPTASPPPWMVEGDPRILPEIGGAVTLGLGHRRHYSPHHPEYREDCVEIARRMGERYGRHRAVVGFQIDNELCGNLNDTGPMARKAFQAWLKRRHGSLEELDRRLGLIFWGQQYDAWEQIPVPVARPDEPQHQPGLRAEWARFTSQSWVAFCKAQVDALRPAIGDKTVTTNCYLPKWGTHIAWPDLIREAGLDVFSFDNYSEDAVDDAFHHDLAASLTHPHWVLEQQCGHPQGQHLWPDPRPPIADALLAGARRGCALFSFFRWRQCRFGCEQDHGAVLDHDGRPGIVYDEVRKAIARVRKEGPFELAEPTVGVVLTWEDAWLAENSARETSYPYMEVVIRRIYAALHAAGERVRFIFEPSGMKGLRRVLAPFKLGHSDEWEQAFEDHVDGGGTIVTFPWLFARDGWNAYREATLDESLHERMGFEFKRRIPLRAAARGAVKRGEQHPLAGAVAADHVDPVDAQVLAEFGDESPIPGSPMAVRLLIGESQWVHCCTYFDAKSLGKVLELLD